MDLGERYGKRSVYAQTVRTEPLVDETGLSETYGGGVENQGPHLTLI